MGDVTDTVPERIPITTSEGAALYRADGTLMYRGDTVAPSGEVLYVLMPNTLRVGAVYSLPLRGRVDDEEREDEDDG